MVIQGKTWKEPMASAEENSSSDHCLYIWKLPEVMWIFGTRVIAVRFKDLVSKMTASLESLAESLSTRHRQIAQLVFDLIFRIIHQSAPLVSL